MDWLVFLVTDRLLVFWVLLLLAGVAWAVITVTLWVLVALHHATGWLPPPLAPALLLFVGTGTPLLLSGVLALLLSMTATLLLMLRRLRHFLGLY